MLSLSQLYFSGVTGTEISNIFFLDTAYHQIPFSPGIGVGTLSLPSSGVQNFKDLWEEETSLDFDNHIKLYGITGLVIGANSLPVKLYYGNQVFTTPLFEITQPQTVITHETISKLANDYSSGNALLSLDGYRLIARTDTCTVNFVFVDRNSNPVSDFFSGTVDTDTLYGLEEIFGQPIPEQAAGLLISSISQDLVITRLRSDGIALDVDNAKLYAPFHLASATNIGLGVIK